MNKNCAGEGINIAIHVLNIYGLRQTCRLQEGTMSLLVNWERFNLKMTTARVILEQVVLECQFIESIESFYESLRQYRSKTLKILQFHFQSSILRNSEILE